MTVYMCNVCVSVINMNECFYAWLHKLRCVIIVAFVLYVIVYSVLCVLCIHIYTITYSILLFFRHFVHATEFGCMAQCHYLNQKALFSRTVNPLAYCRFLRFILKLCTVPHPVLLTGTMTANYAFICILQCCWAHIFIHVSATLVFWLAEYTMQAKYLSVSVLQTCNIQLLIFENRLRSCKNRFLLIVESFNHTFIYWE